MELGIGNWELAQEKKEIFIQKLLEWNSVHNLTGATTKEEVEKNIADSLEGLRYIKTKPKVALDIGTGAGFPGLVLAMAMPETKWYLIEPRKKRAAFLSYIKGLLGLENTKVIQKRIEDMVPFKADLITSRAVMKTKDLLQLVKDFIKEDTTLLLYKGENVENELDGLQNYAIYKQGKRRYLIIKSDDG